MSADQPTAGGARFPADLERSFRDDYAERSLGSIRRGLGLGLFLYAAFGLLDPWIVPGVLTQIWSIRFLAVCPLIVLVLAFTLWPGFTKVMQPALAATSVAGGVGIVAMISLAKGAGSYAYYAGLILIVLAAPTLFRLRFWWALSSNLLIVVAYQVVAIELGTPTVILVNNDFFLFSAGFMAILSNYDLEMSFRRAFLQRHDLAERTEQLRLSNLSLVRAQDKLAELTRDQGEAEDISAWSHRMAMEVAEGVGAREIRVFELADGSFVPVTPGEGRAPAMTDLAESGRMSGPVLGNDTVLAIRGMTGQLLGAMVVTGAHRIWSDGERGLVAGFSRYLGGALEVLTMRRQLALAQDRRRQSREMMHRQGIATVQVCPKCQRCYDNRAERCSIDASELTSPGSLPFIVLERYRLGRLLGRGGMGLVFEATDERLARPVAIKILRSDEASDPLTRERFSREAQAVARIRHPGVVELYDSGELDDGSGVLIMELLRGHDLAAMISRHGRGKPSQVAAVLHQVGKAMGAAHRAGFVHRDLKPQNIMLLDGTGPLSVKVLDFGIARLTTRGSTLTGTGVVVGTPTYMSPEQIQGRPLDHRSDIYSLAVVGYEALTGTRLVASGELIEIMLAVLSATPPLLSSLIEGASPALDQAFASALSKDPQKRPSDIEAWTASLLPEIEKLPSDLPGWPQAEPAGDPVPTEDGVVQPTAELARTERLSPPVTQDERTVG